MTTKSRGKPKSIHAWALYDKLGYPKCNGSGVPDLFALRDTAKMFAWRRSYAGELIHVPRRVTIKVSK